MMRYIILIVSLVLSACSPVNSSSPARSVSSDSSSASTESAEASKFLNEYRAGEAEAILKSNGLALRTEEKLTISYDEKPVAAFTDKWVSSCSGYETCTLWRFDGVINLYDKAQNSLKPYVVVKKFNGEDEQYAIVLTDGEVIWFALRPLVSPNGKVLVSGFNDNTFTEPFTSVIEWDGSRIEREYISDAPCEPENFISDSQIVLKCQILYPNENFGTYYSARLSKSSKGLWEITANVVAKQNAISLKDVPIAKDHDAAQANRSEIGYAILKP